MSKRSLKGKGKVGKGGKTKTRKGDDDVPSSSAQFEVLSDVESNVSFELGFDDDDADDGADEGVFKLKTSDVRHLQIPKG
jgi:hypothetical protein